MVRTSGLCLVRNSVQINRGKNNPIFLVKEHFKWSLESENHI